MPTRWGGGTKEGILQVAHESWCAGGIDRCMGLGTRRLGSLIGDASENL